MRGTPTTLHPDPHPLAGKTVKIVLKAPLRCGEYFKVGEQLIFELEDWQDRVYDGISWRDAGGNPAAMLYASRISLPNDDLVVYGKIQGFGAMIHVSELEGEVKQVGITHKSGVVSYKAGDDTYFINDVTVNEMWDVTTRIASYLDDAKNKSLKALKVKVEELDLEIEAIADQIVEVENILSSLVELIPDPEEGEE